jgi:hypothetical protein
MVSRFFQAHPKLSQIQQSRAQAQAKQIQEKGLDFLGFPWFSFAVLSLFKQLRRPPRKKILFWFLGSPETLALEASPSIL